MNTSLTDGPAPPPPPADNLPQHMGLMKRIPPRWRAVGETVLTLAVAGAIAWLAQAYVVKPYTVPSESMEPTLMPGDYVLADRLSLDIGDPRRYQIVVFHPPHCKQGLNDSHNVCSTTSLKLRDGASGTTYVKRVIGLPGDTIWPKNGHLWVKPAHGTAFQLKEPWVRDGNELAGTPIRRMHIPAGFYLMLGDYRGVSDDSRVWGLEPRGDMIGVARVRYWPLGRLGIL